MVKKHTEDAIKLIAKSSAGVFNSMYGKKHSLETKDKISAPLAPRPLVPLTGDEARGTRLRPRDSAVLK